MSKAELLAEFTKLSPAERNELWDGLWALEERQLLDLGAPSAEEKTVLEGELEDYQKRPEAGAPWKDIEARLRNRR
jgi:hypothetical protein